MDSNLVRDLGELLGGAYPRWDATPMTWAVFLSVCEGLPRDCIMAAAWTWVRERKWPPAPSELREAAESYAQYLERGQGGRYISVRMGTTTVVAYGRDDLRSLLGLVEAKNAQAQHIAEEIERQTRRSPRSWLDEWDAAAASEMEMRRDVVASRARGKFDDGGELPALPAARSEEGK